MIMRGWPARILAVLLLGMGFAAAVPEASADISRDLGESTGFLLDYLEGRVPMGGERTIVVNGQVLRARLGETSLRPDALFDRLERRALALLEARPLPAGDDAEVAQARVERALRRPQRFSAEGWGAFVQLFGGHPGDLGGLLPAFAESGEVGTPGGFIAVALRPDRARTTDVWLMELDADFSPEEYIGTGEGDVGPGDFPGVARFPGSQRTMTLSELGGSSEVHLVAYEGGGTVEAHLAHYQKIFRSMGMSEAPVTRRGRHEAMARFADDSREVTVFVQRTDSPDRSVIDLIQVSMKGPVK